MEKEEIGEEGKEDEDEEIAKRKNRRWRKKKL